MMNRKIRHRLQNLFFVAISLILLVSCEPLIPPPLKQPSTTPSWSANTQSAVSTNIYATQIDDFGNSYVYEDIHYDYVDLGGKTISGDIQKYDALGALVWDSRDIGVNIRWNYLKLDASTGNVYSYGYNSETKRFHVVKIDTAGVVSWLIDTPPLRDQHVTLLPSQEIVTAGLTPSLSGVIGEYDLLFERYDALGNKVVSQRFDATQIDRQDRVEDMVLGPDGNLHLVLSHYQRCYTQAGSLTLVTLDPSGAMVFSKNIRMTTGTYEDKCSIKIGLHGTSTGINRYLLTYFKFLKLDETGNLAWQIDTGNLAWGMLSSRYENFKIDALGGVILYTESVIPRRFFRKISSAGQTLWSINEKSMIWNYFRLTGHYYEKSVVDQDGSIYLGGIPLLSLSYAYKIIKISGQNGKYQWSRQLTNPQPLPGVSVIHLDENDNLYITGGNSAFSINYTWYATFVLDAQGKQLSANFYNTAPLFGDNINYQPARIDSFGNLYSFSEVDGFLHLDKYPANYFLPAAAP